MIPAIFMKKSIILLTTVSAGIFIFWIFKNYFPQEKPAGGNASAPSEIAIAKPQEFQEFEFKIQEATSTINISLDETEIDVFYLVMIDVDKLLQNKEESMIWVISSIMLDKPPDISMKKKDVPNFISFPYIIGEKREGFFSGQSEKINLEAGREYYLQLIGFDEDANLKASAQTFKFGQR